MRCKACQKRSNETRKRPRLSRRAKVARCERCGALILPLPDMMLGAGDGTLAQLTRFGLAFTGDPLLELKREGG